MYVYFISAYGEHELQQIKIGYSNDPDGRLKKLQTGSPIKLKLLGTVKCNSEAHARQVEKLAHNIFHKQKRRGEWYKLSKKHISQIESLIKTAAARQAEMKNDLKSDPLYQEYRGIVGNNL